MTRESGALSKTDRLNQTARRQIEALGRRPGFLADRMTILDTAKAWLENQGVEDPDLMDILSTAEFLAGDRITE